MSEPALFDDNAKSAPSGNLVLVILKADVRFVGRVGIRELPQGFARRLSKPHITLVSIRPCLATNHKALSVGELLSIKISTA
jgi:hypothetical protein